MNQEWRHNRIGQMAGVYEPGVSTPIISYEYDAAGNLIKESRKNSAETTYQYNESNLLKQMSNKKGSNIITKNGLVVDLDYPVILEGERTMVPLNAISESFAIPVDWDGDNQAITITQD